LTFLHTSFIGKAQQREGDFYFMKGIKASNIFAGTLMPTVSQSKGGH
jgi:hypothetical protein